MRPITEKEIMAAQTEKGGWKKSQLQKWGVPWPEKGNPPTGWKEKILKYQASSYAEALHREMDEQCDEARYRDRK